MSNPPKRKCRSNPILQGIEEIPTVRKSISDSCIDSSQSSEQAKLPFEHSIAPLMVRDLHGNVDVNDIPKDMGIVVPRGLSQRRLKIVSVNEMDTERSAHNSGINKTTDFNFC